LTFNGKLQPWLCFGGFGFRIVQFGYKGRLITAFPPRLDQISAYRPRSSPDLARQRVPVFSRESF
jgi:hypothetical protein